MTILCRTIITKEKQRGLAVVEFVVAFPLLMLLFFFMVEAGRAFYQYNAIYKGARDAARYLANHSPTRGSTGVADPDYQSIHVPAAKKLAQCGKASGSCSTSELLVPDLDSNDIAVSNQNGDVTVTVQYCFTPAVNPAFLGVSSSTCNPAGFRLSSAVTMTRLR